MGAEPYWYVVKYNPKIEDALEELRDREFAAGRYNPVMPFLTFPITPQSPAPGAQHDSIADAVAESDADGTRSILDILSISEEPDFCSAAPLCDETLTELYGTTKPTRAAVEANMEFLEDVERGHAVYIILYKNGKPDELMFAGYSFD
ncbi:MAG: hypothetical protein L0Y72_22765 [Gemmataceae bacterium]|nr:hypothetical protein [Gemmataceae bacterium]MCI0741866.1 hypothetical protein [Gemmataceae bacterium]